MSRFLKNLITRGQTDSANPNGSYIVQPRPRSRFESTSHVETSTDQRATDNESSTTATSILSSVNPKMGTGTQTNTDKINPAINRQTDEEHNFISALKQPSEQNFISQEMASFTSQIKSRAESASSTERSPQSDNRNDSQKLSPSDELNQRIQTILQHLNTPQAQPAGEPSSAEEKQHTAFSNAAITFDKNAVSGSEGLPLMPDQALGFEHRLNTNDQGIDNRHGQRETHQTGSLQTPNWLTEMQSVLSSRLREMNAQEKSEPVINVTIGRVEVRAVQTAPAQQSKPQNKPSGIMSLDDYLEKRNKGQS